MVAAPGYLFAPQTKGWVPEQEPLPGVVVPIQVSARSHRPMLATPEPLPGVVVPVLVSDHFPPNTPEIPDDHPSISHTLFFYPVASDLFCLLSFPHDENVHLGWHSTEVVS